MKHLFTPLLLLHLIQVILLVQLKAQPIQDNYSSKDTIPHVTTVGLPTLLKTTDEAVKQKSLNYLEYLAADTDNTIRLIFEQLSPEKQHHYLQYLQSIRKQKPDRTRVKWDTTVLDVGKIKSGILWRGKLNVKNIGEHPYFISDIQTRCYCLQISKPKFPIMPGESAELEVELNTYNLLGLLDMAIVVRDNSEPNANNILRVSGLVESKKP